MGPVSTRWYEENNIPYVLKKTSGKLLPQIEYKDFTSYSGGRIDIYGLDEEEYYAGKDEYGIGIMLSEDWYALSEWLDDFETDELLPYKELISEFEKAHGKQIRWWQDET